MARLLWEASDDLRRNANITAFMQAVNQRHGLNLTTYPELHRWSIEHIPEFWAMVWDHAGTIASKKYDKVVDDPYRMPGTRWFEGARMNFAENLLRRRDDHVALVFRGEDQVVQSVTYAGLYAMVAGLANSLREMGVKPGDRVVGYMPNMIETAAAMLAATAIGATWASCATDIGDAAPTASDRWSRWSFSPWTSTSTAENGSTSSPAPPLWPARCPRCARWWSVPTPASPRQT